MGGGTEEVGPGHPNVAPPGKTIPEEETHTSNVPMSTPGQ